MAKLSDIFGRKGGMAGADKFAGRPQNGNSNGGDHISIENLSDVGSRMGEENEVLRNLLTDTGRKISELDDLKRVEDLNSALQRERMERAVVEGALEAARKDNSRLQSEVAALRSTLRRGAPLDDMPVPPAEAANDEAPPKGKRAKSTELSEAGGKA